MASAWFHDLYSFIEIYSAYKTPVAETIPILKSSGYSRTFMRLETSSRS